MGGGQYRQLALPAGTADFEGSLFPLEPVPIDRVFPLRSADIPWQPERPERGVVDLSQEWRTLFWERQAFTPWGNDSPPFHAAFRACERVRGPRPTFRAGAKRRQMRFIFPQLVPANVCYRLADAYTAVQGQDRHLMIVSTGDLTLRAGDGLTATAGVDPLGWYVALRRASADPQTVRQLADAVPLLSAAAEIWDQVASPRHRLLLGTH